MRKDFEKSLLLGRWRLRIFFFSLLWRLAWSGLLGLCASFLGFRAVAGFYVNYLFAHARKYLSYELTQ